MMALLAQALTKMRRDAVLVLLNVVGYPALILLAFAWLWIPDSHVWEFALSMILGPAIVIAALALLIVTMARWNSVERFTPTKTLRHLPGMLVWIALAGGALLLIGMVADRDSLYASYLASRPSQGVRYLLTYQRILRLIDFVVAVVTYFLLPSLLLPPACETSTYGLLHIRWRRCAAVFRNWRYWLAQAVLALIAVWIPILLLGWTPGHRLREQVVSVSLRILCAYLLTIGALLFSIALVGTLMSGGETTEVPLAPEPDLLTKTS